LVVPPNEAASMNLGAAVIFDEAGNVAEEYVLPVTGKSAHYKGKHFKSWGMYSGHESLRKEPTPLARLSESQKSTGDLCQMTETKKAVTTQKGGSGSNQVARSLSSTGNDVKVTNTRDWQFPLFVGNESTTSNVSYVERLDAKKAISPKQTIFQGPEQL